MMITDHNINEISYKLENFISSTNPSFHNLSQDQQKIITLLVAQSKDHLIKDLWRLIYEVKPPTIEEFLSPESLGLLSHMLFPYWKERLSKEVFFSGSLVNEVIFSGSTGCGKSTAGMICQVYNLIRVALMKNPQLMFNVAPTSLLAVLLINVAGLYKAQMSLIRPFVEILKTCSYFEEVKSEFDLKDVGHGKIPFLFGKGNSEDIILSKNIVTLIGSREIHAISLNLFGAILDEAEFSSGDSIEIGFNTYLTIRERLRTRFLGKRNLMLNLISSAKTDTGVINKYIDSVDKTDRHLRLFAASVWEVKEDDPWKNGYFYVLRGTKTTPSKILEEYELEKHDKNEFVTPIGCEVIKVPMGYIQDFNTGVDRALRNVAGVQTIGDEQIFTSLSSFDNYDKNLTPEMEVIAPLGSIVSLIDKISSDVFIVYPNGKRKFKRYPNSVRYCFTGDTKVMLLSGNSKSMEELVLDHESGKENWVYSWSPNGWAPGKIVSAHLSKIVNNLIQITLDNNEIIKCTPDHRFMLRDGSYKEAQYLTPDDSLMSLYRRYDDNGYEEIFDNKNQKWKYIHLISDNILTFVENKIENNNHYFRDHKVLSVSRILCKNTMVYDLTISDPTNSHNFVLDAGVVVSNSAIDLAETTEAAVCILHKELGDENEELYVVDVLAKITSPDRINIESIQDLFIDLRREAGVLFEVITADKFQSSQLLQKLKKLNIGKEVKPRSIGEQVPPYYQVARVVALNRLKIGYCPGLKDQANALKERKGKPHTRIRKDKVDALTGALINALETPKDIPIERYSRAGSISIDMSKYELM